MLAHACGGLGMPPSIRTGAPHPGTSARRDALGGPPTGSGEPSQAQNRAAASITRATSSPGWTDDAERACASTLAQMLFASWEERAKLREAREVHRQHRVNQMRQFIQRQQAQQRAQPAMQVRLRRRCRRSERPRPMALRAGSTSHRRPPARRRHSQGPRRLPRRRRGRGRPSGGRRPLPHKAGRAALPLHRGPARRLDAAGRRQHGSFRPASRPAPAPAPAQGLHRPRRGVAEA